MARPTKTTKTSAKRPGRKGTKPLHAQRLDMPATERAAREAIFKGLADAINHGRKALLGEESGEELGEATLEDLDEMLESSNDGDDGARDAINQVDPRPYRQILKGHGRQRTGFPGPFSRSTHGNALAPDDRQRLAEDILELLELFREVGVESLGTIAAFDYELEAVTKLHELTNSLRKNKEEYRKRVQWLRAVVALRAIYGETTDAWSARLSDEAQRVILDRQREALDAFVQEHGLATDPPMTVDALFRPADRITKGDEKSAGDRQAIRRGMPVKRIGLKYEDEPEHAGGPGPLKTATAALARFFGVADRTLEESLERSPLEESRVLARRTLRPTHQDDAEAFDRAIDVLGKLFTVLTERPWPYLSLSSKVHGWGRVRAEMKALLSEAQRGKLPTDDEAKWKKLAPFGCRPTGTRSTSSRSAGCVRSYGRLSSHRIDGMPEVEFL